jgi:hypothetical protein
MTPEEEQTVANHVRELAKLLYKDADASRMTSLGDIEAVVREQVQKHVTPEMGSFLSKQLQAQAIANKLGTGKNSQSVKVHDLLNKAVMGG